MIDLSVVVVAHDMRREIPRTVRSLSPPYQRGIAPARIEIIVADNGSSEPVDPVWFDGVAADVRLIRFPSGNPSPCAAINAGIAAARGALVTVLVDGARLASPGLLTRGLEAMRLGDDVFAAAMGFHLGHETHQTAVSKGYGPDIEDGLLAGIGWPDDGYRLFEICVRAESHRDGVLSPFPEATAFMMRRSSFERLGGFDEAFRYAGGGLACFEFFERVIADESVMPVVLIGEGTFHQVHYGITTRAGGVRRTESPAGPTIWDAMALEYQTLVGRAPLTVQLRKPVLFGRCENDVVEHCFFGRNGHGTIATDDRPVAIELEPAPAQLEPYAGTLVRDPVLVAEAVQAFESDLAVPDGSLAEIDRAALADAVARSLDVLADRLGWRKRIAVRFAQTDLSRVRALPETAHHFACVFRVTAGEFDVILNSSWLRFGTARLLMSRLPALVWLFGSALELEPSLEGDFPCMLGDPSFWPVVSFSGSHERACLIPDADFFASGGYRSFRETMTEPPAWESRLPAVFWRGSTTGTKRYWPPSSRADVQWLPRLELCARSGAAGVAGLCDVGITALVQVPADWAATVAQTITPFMRAPVEKAAFANFKAVIDIDGNSNAWSGLFTSLLTGACVIKIESEHGFAQWYYDRLKPWVHYVPVKPDFSDFEEAVGFVLADDDAARAIAEAGCRLARSIDFGAEMSAAAQRLVDWAASTLP